MGRYQTLGPRVLHYTLSLILIINLKSNHTMKTLPTLTAIENMIATKTRLSLYNAERKLNAERNQLVYNALKFNKLHVNGEVIRDSQSGLKPLDIVY